jgi:LmbE family N-acetylglucosaminyl deacetylase
MRAAEPQGAALLKADLLCVFAHPDDETGMAATLARYALGEGKVVAHAYVTRGEGGANMVGRQSGPSLGILREAELRNCLAILGVGSCHFLEQEDFFYTESLYATLRKWDRQDALRRLVRIIRALRPEVIATMNPAPRPGQHGHHQAAGVLATEGFLAAADPRRFPEQLTEEGLEAWQARKLFYGGAQGTHIATINTTEPLPDGRVPADVAAEALRHHRSQGFGSFTSGAWLRRPQLFTVVHTAVEVESATASLFAGLPGSNAAQLVRLAQPPPPPELAFVPRPAIARYLQWSREQGIDHLASTFSVDIPVVAGRPNMIALDVAPELRKRARSAVKLELPEGWTSHSVAAADSPDRGADGQLRFEVVPPVAAESDVEIRASADRDNDEIRATARLHPVPWRTVPRVERGPSLDGSQAPWQRGAVLTIGTNKLWQGTVENERDCSAEVRLLHDARRLLVDVHVRDDHVISNIEPNDIRGHWRSDSIEICLDPAAGAEDTTGCFKLGIFPFDTAGRVRAARDADAKQGPVEITAPGVQLASERTDEGYRIQAAIPLALVWQEARNTSPLQRMGFNVLIYDGDKRDATAGENINEARLAWAPRSGVQGRPEDWGRIELE